MNLRKLFAKKPRATTQEIAPQLTTYERRSLALPTGPEAPYREMMRDTMLQTAIMIKRRAVTTVEFQIVPADESAEAKRRAAFVEENFAAMSGSPLTVLDQAMDALVNGWSVQELVYEPRNNQVWLSAVRAKNPHNFGLQFDAFGSLLGLTLRVDGEGERPLPVSKFVVYRYRSGFDRPRGASDLDATLPHWRAKQSILKAWKLHLERFASPTVMARVPRGISAAEQESMARALHDLHENTAIVFPSEIEVSTIGGHRETISGFLDAIEFHNREMARSILGQTLTTDEGRRVGSLALGKVHLQVLLLHINSLRRELADSVMTEQVIRPLVELNFGPGLVPRFEFAQTPLESFVTGKIA